MSDARSDDRWKRAAMAVLAVAALAGTSCAQSIPDCKAEPPSEPPPPSYVLVEYSMATTAGAPPDLSSKETPKLREVRPRVSSVAVRAPDACLAPIDPNVPGPPRIVLTAECAPWIGELEGALTSAGYRVFSWDALIQVEREQSLTTYAAAKRLGADVVFVFAQLDVVDIEVAATGNDSLRYFIANERGDAVGPAIFDTATETDLAARVDRILAGGSRPRTPGLKSTIDGSAVLPDSGEVVWLFRRTATLPIGPPMGLRILFGRYGRGQWKPVAPDSTMAPTSHSPFAPGRRGRLTDADEPGSDAVQAERSKLVRDGAAAFVQSFGGVAP